MRDESHQHFHHHFHFDPQFEVRLGVIEGMLDLILENEEQIMASVADLTMAVEKNTASVDAVVALMDAGGMTFDQASFDAAVTKLGEDTARLDKAVADHK